MIAVPLPCIVINGCDVAFVLFSKVYDLVVFVNLIILSFNSYACGCNLKVINTVWNCLITLSKSNLLTTVAL